jgi:hypothetical protein
MSERLHAYACEPGATGHGGMAHDGLVHIEGLGINGHETLCGYVDTYLPWGATNKPVTCPGCIAVYRACRTSDVRIASPRRRSTS